MALLAAAAMLLLTGATWSRCGGAGCPDLGALAAREAPLRVQAARGAAGEHAALR